MSAHDASADSAIDTVVLVVNGERRTVDVDDPRMPLVFVLRDRLGLRGTKLSCGCGECGACAVLVDGVEERACMLAIGDLDGSTVTTIEGIGDGGTLHPVQVALLAEQASQCGYCLPGIVVAASALLARDPDPSETTIATTLAGHLCRCGTYGRVVRALRRAAVATKGRAT
jgi:aerobic-type carbon monoxide dehydrogenase small subunit (CoxS/CutS family)